MSTDADTDDTAPPAAQPAERELGRLPRGLTLRTDDGVRWVTCDALSHGDYGGYGSHGVANVRDLPAHAEHPDWWPDDADHTDTDRGGYGGVTAWCLDTHANRELLRGLVDDYPALDDVTVSAVESEWEDEALRDYGLTDIGRELGRHYGGAWRDAWDDLPSGWADDAPDGRTDATPTQLDVYALARELTNTYPTPEYSGVCLHVDRLAPEVARCLLPTMLATPEGRAELDDWLARDVGDAVPPPAWRDGPALLTAVCDELQAAGPSTLANLLAGYVRRFGRFADARPKA